MTKRFLGPLVCVTFGYLAIRWAIGIVAFARLWPWSDFSPPPSQAYFLAVVGGVSFGIAPLWLFCVFIYMGWQWFKTREAQT